MGFSQFGPCKSECAQLRCCVIGQSWYNSNRSIGAEHRNIGFHTVGIHSLFIIDFDRSSIDSGKNHPGLEELNKEDTEGVALPMKLIPNLVKEAKSRLLEQLLANNTIVQNKGFNLSAILLEFSRILVQEAKQSEVFSESAEKLSNRNSSSSVPIRALQFHLLEDFLIQLVDDLFLSFVSDMVAKENHLEEMKTYVGVWKETKESVEEKLTGEFGPEDLTIPNVLRSDSANTATSSVLSDEEFSPLEERKASQEVISLENLKAPEKIAVSTVTAKGGKVPIMLPIRSMALSQSPRITDMPDMGSCKVSGLSSSSI